MVDRKRTKCEKSVGASLNRVLVLSKKRKRRGLGTGSKVKMERAKAMLRAVQEDEPEQVGVMADGQDWVLGVTEEGVDTVNSVGASLNRVLVFSKKEAEMIMVDSGAGRSLFRKGA